MLNEDQVREIRSRFKIFQSKIYLNTSSRGALSAAVESSFDDCIASWHEQGTSVERCEEARIAMVTGVSAIINGIASALNFRDCRKVVMGEFEFPTTGQVWLGQRVRGAGVAEYD